MIANCQLSIDLLQKLPLAKVVFVVPNIEALVTETLDIISTVVVVLMTVTNEDLWDLTFNSVHRLQPVNIPRCKLGCLATCVCTHALCTCRSSPRHTYKVLAADFTLLILSPDKSVCNLPFRLTISQSVSDSA